MKMTDSFYVDGMDPGGTTGLVLLRITPDAYHVTETAAVRYQPDEGDSPVLTLKRWRTQYNDLPHVMVYEDFHVRPGQRHTPDTTALSIIGALRGWAHGTSRSADLVQALTLLNSIRRSTYLSVYAQVFDQAMELLDGIEIPGGARSEPYDKVVSQEPVTGKSVVTDEVLKRLGVRVGGPYGVHINDAMRHAMTWLAMQGHPVVCTTGWPPPPDLRCEA